MVSGSTSEKDKGEPKMVFKYDLSTGKLVEDASVRPSGKVIYKTAYKYDQLGRMIEITGYGSDGRVESRRVYGFTGDQRVPSSFAYHDGQGNVYERTVYSDYEFNSQGDWIRRKESTEERFNRRSVSSTIREIEYYPSGR
jgi:hypothetical protein